MTKEQQYWENTQKALSRIFDRCEEIDPQSGYDMLKDIQFVRGFINKHKSWESENKVFNKIRAEVKRTRKVYLDMNDSDWVNGCDYVLSVIDKYKAESEE